MSLFSLFEYFLLVPFWITFFKQNLISFPNFVCSAFKKPNALKTLGFQGVSALLWRRSGDSNPGYLAVYMISNHAPSTGLGDFSVLPGFDCFGKNHARACFFAIVLFAAMRFRLRAGRPRLRAACLWLWAFSPSSPFFLAFPGFPACLVSLLAS